MPRHTYRYVAFRPMGNDHKIVHICADERDVTYRFISFEYHQGGVTLSWPQRNRDDILLVKTRWLDAAAIKERLAEFNGCEPEDIEIETHMSVWLTVNGDSNDAGSSRWEQVGR